MLEVIGYIAIFVVVLTILLIIHEAGHFFVAKAAGVKVLEFGVGFPPRLLGLRHGETVYSLNAVPFGAFVKMAGEEDPTEARSLAGKSAGVRLLVLGAGPFMNALLAVVLFTVLFTIPQDVLVGNVLVQEVQNGSPAQEAGIQPADIILEANGQALDNHGDLTFLVNLKLGTEMSWLVAQGDQRMEVGIQPLFNPPEYREGVDLLAGDVVIQEVAPGSPAQGAGILPGDIIVEAAGQAVDSHSDLIYLVDRNLGTSMTWMVQREDQRFPVELTPRLNPPEGQGAVGIILTTVNYRVESRAESPWTEGRRGFDRIDEAGLTLTTVSYRYESRSNPPWTAARKGVVRMGEILVLIKNEFTKWTSGGSPPEVSGPVGIGHIFVEVGQTEGVTLADRALVFLQLAAVISLVLSVFNFLPIPALDGGRIFFVVIELARRGKRISPEREGFVHMVGFAVLITFLLFVTFMDLSKLGESLLGG